MMKKLIFVFAVAYMSVLTVRSVAQVKDSTKSDTTARTSNTAPATQAAAPSGDIVLALTTTGYNVTLSSAIKTAGLESALQDAGPITFFAPADKTFANATGTADSLLKNPEKLKMLLNNHIVTGKYGKAEIIKALTVGKGTATLPTLGGGVLTLKINADKNLELTDANGDKALVTVFDVAATNGVINVVDGLLVPPSSI